MKKILIWLMVSSPVLYGSTCTIFSKFKDNAFDIINVGDSQESVIKLLGNVYVHEKSDSLFPRYASNKCRNPCVERLWFENQFAVGVEAWSVELDSQNRVVNKTHWVLP